MVDSVSVRFKKARVEKVPLNIRIQWNAGTACVSECVLKTLACRGLRVGPSKFPKQFSFPENTQTLAGIACTIAEGPGGVFLCLTFPRPKWRGQILTTRAKNWAKLSGHFRSFIFFVRGGGDEPPKFVPKFL